MQNYIIYPKQFRNENIMIDKNKCFMVMPFREELNTLYAAIQAMLAQDGITVIRADEAQSSNLLFNKIMREMLSANYVLVDMTYINANVFYELGIAHSFKDSDNIILIKQKEAKCPSDIQYLEYIDYTLTDPRELVTNIKKRIAATKYISDFYDALNTKGIIPYVNNNQQEFVEYMRVELESYIPFITRLLIGENAFTDVEVANLLNAFECLISKLIKDNKFKTIKGVLDTYYEIIIACAELPIAREYTERFISSYNDVSDAIVWKIDLVVKLTRNRKLLNITLNWIMQYFSCLHATTIDLNRHHLERLLITSQHSEVNQAMIAALYNENCYLREYMADIIGEKHLTSALEDLYCRLQNEENCYVARSIVQAIGKIDNVHGCERLLKWFAYANENYINQKYYGIFTHVSHAIAKMDTTSDGIFISEFRKQYGEYLK